MSLVKVLDTGVLIGVIVSQDQHHAKCIEYVADFDGDAYATPTVGDEFKQKLSEIRGKLRNEILNHRKEIVKQVGKKQLGRTELVKIREKRLDDEWNAHRFLFEFYSKLADEGGTKRQELTNKLSNMATEVGQDGAKEHGGFNALVDGWPHGVKPYPNVRSNLLIHEGDDPDVCIEAHHVAVTIGGETELGTTNPKHFIRKHESEPESREENILRETNLSHIEDLSMDRYP
jgi:predicted nucleic acid-binding protein